jgi:RecA-family ATPase
VSEPNVDVDAELERIRRERRAREVDSAQNKRGDEPPADDGELLGWDAGDDDQMPPPRGWLLGTSFCRGFASSLLGDGGVGKTALRYAQGLSLATKRALTGEHVFQRCRVLIVSLEDGRDELRRRLRAACLHHGIERSELKGWLFIEALGRADGKLLTLDQHNRPVLGALAAKLERTIAARKIDIVMLDPFIKSHGIAENDNSGIDEVAQILTNMAEKFNIAVDVPPTWPRDRLIRATPTEAVVLRH